jgi:hypothetical protein
LKIKSTWCDKLGSTPAVGIRADTHFATTETLLTSFAPLLDRMAGSVERPDFTLEKSEQFAMVFTTKEGFRYSADAAKLSVTFQHRIRAKQVSGGPPTMELLSLSRPYTELLPESTRRLIEAALILPQNRNRRFHRVGFVSTTVVSPEDAPPGIENFTRYIGRPWKTEAEFYQVQVATQLNVGAHWKDRCIHTVIKPEETDEEPLLTIVFDWQRNFYNGRPITRSSLEESLSEAQIASLNYLEELGVGGQFDEQIINREVE